MSATALELRIKECRDKIEKELKKPKGKRSEDLLDYWHKDMIARYEEQHEERIQDEERIERQRIQTQIEAELSKPKDKQNSDLIAWWQSQLGVNATKHLIPITHWQQIVTKIISLSETTTLHDFHCQIRALFHEEIDTELFRVYELPPKFTSVDQGVHVDTDERLREVIRKYSSDSFILKPHLYVWNHEILPLERTAKANSQAKSRASTSENVSRISASSSSFKKRDSHSCLCCGHSGIGIEGDHIYESNAHKKVDIGDRESKLTSLNFVNK